MDRGPARGQQARLHNDFYRIGEAMAWAEQEYGLTLVARADRTAGHRPSRAETEKARRAGRDEAPRTTLRRQVAAAAAAARSEAEFFAGLDVRGLAVRLRTSTTQPGEVTGYAVGLPGDRNADGGQVWYGGGKLAADLTLPKLRRRWASGPRRLSGRGMSSQAARAALRSEVARCAAIARSEPEFWARLQAAGLRVRKRADPARTGHATGYAVALPGLTARRDWRPLWFADGTLDDRLTLPALRPRWRMGQPGAAPGAELFAGAEVNQIYQHAAQAARLAARELKYARPRLDVAWAAADVVTAAAEATGNPELLRAAEGLSRAARASWGRIPPPSHGGTMLRTASYFLAACRGYPRRVTWITFLIELARLADAIAQLRAQQRRTLQEKAARGAAAVLRAPTVAPAQTPVQVATRTVPRRRLSPLAARRVGPARAPRR